MAVAVEHNSPDLWALARRNRELLTADESDNTPFTPQEQHELKARVDEIGRFLIESQRLNTEGQARVEAKIEYVAGAVERLGRRDWLGIFVSAIVSFVVSEGLQSDAARGLVAFANAQLMGTYQWLKQLPSRLTDLTP
jgi:hypothetical protein